MHDARVASVNFTPGFPAALAFQANRKWAFMGVGDVTPGLERLSSGSIGVSRQTDRWRGAESGPQVEPRNWASLMRSIARAGFRFFGQTSVQFMMVRQR